MIRKESLIMKLGFALLSVAVVSCGQVTKPDRTTRDYSAKLTEASERLMHEGFTYGPYISSLDDNGARDELGEGILYGALALGFLPCQYGATLESELASRVVGRNGVVERTEPIGEYANGRELNFDGETGLLTGLLIRVTRCGASAELSNLWKARSDFYRSNAGRLHPNTSERLPGSFSLFRRALDSRLASGSDLEKNDRIKVVTDATIYAVSQMPTKGPGYRIHLSWLYLVALDYAGYAVDRAPFCSGIKGSGIELIEHWCGRGDLEQWIDNYKYDEKGYSWQRAKWESNSPRFKEPGLDLIMALTLISR